MSLGLRRDPDRQLVHRRRVCFPVAVLEPRFQDCFGTHHRGFGLFARHLLRQVDNLPLTPEVVRSISRHWCFDDSRARGELDWRPRRLADGLPPAVEFLLDPPSAG